MTRSAFVAVVALLVSGCMLGPDYSRPPVVVPGNYRFAVAPATAESIADLPWFDVFRDPVLQQLVREALQNNYDLRIAASRVEEARANIGIVRSFLYPQINFNAVGGAQQVSRTTDPPQSFGADRNYQNLLLGFALAWELDVFGRIRRDSEAATAIFLATEQAQRGVLITLVADVAVSYFTLRELDLELEIARRTVQLNDETVKFYQTRLTGGASNRLELDTAISNRSRTASTIPELERQIAIQENQINLLLGRNPGPIPRGTVADRTVLSAKHSRGLTVGAARAASRYKNCGGVAGCCQRQHWRCQGAFFPKLFTDVRARERDSRSIQPRRQARGHLVSCKRHAAAGFSGLAPHVKL